MNRTRRRPPRERLHDFHGRVGADLDAPAGFQFAPRVAHGEPAAGGQRAHEEELRGFRAAAAIARPQQPRRHHAGRVHDDDVDGRDETGQVAELRVPDRAGGPLEDEQTARGAVGERILSDEVRRQVVGEIAGAQAAGHASKIVGCSAVWGGVNPKWR